VDFKVFIDEVSEFSDKLLGRSSRERVCEMIRVLTSEFHRWLGRHAGRARAELRWPQAPTTHRRTIKTLKRFLQFLLKLLFNDQ
jgi:acyl-CoA hydrolase